MTITHVTFSPTWQMHRLPNGSRVFLPALYEALKDAHLNTTLVPNGGAFTNPYDAWRAAAKHLGTYRPWWRFW